jgi:hypothetical protein
VADTWRPMIRTDVAMLAEPSRVVVPRGPLLLSIICGARDNHDHDSRTDGTPRIWDARGFRFSVIAPPSHHPALTDEQDLDPLVSIWVCRARSVGMKRHAQWVAAYLGG